MKISYSSAIIPVTMEKGIGTHVIPVTNIKIPMIRLMMRIMPCFFTFVRKSINGIPPMIPIIDESSMRKIGISPVIASAITTTK